MRLELVKDWMSRDVMTVTPTMSLREADALMRLHGIRRLPVVVDGRLVGIVTSGDLREADTARLRDLGVTTRNDSLSQLIVAQIMTPNPLTILPDKTIGEAAQQMLQYAIGALPVVTAGGELAGIITESDIFRMVVHDWMSAQGSSTEPYTRYDV